MAALLLFTQGAWADDAVNVEPSQTLTEIRKMGDCTVYAFNYPSVSATGQSTVLSSALFAWTPASRQETDSIESLHIFSHITITNDDERLTTTKELSKEQNLLLFLPGREYNYPLGGEQADYVGRCIVIAPDYEGYGVTKDVPHPYLSQRVTAQQMIDGVKYGLELYQKMAKESETLLPMKSDWRSFCMGFSQGGADMWRRSLRPGDHHALLSGGRRHELWRGDNAPQGSGHAACRGAPDTEGHA